MKITLSLLILLQASLNEALAGREKRDVNNMVFLEEISLTTEQKQILLDDHNTFRRQELTASNMRIMTWDDEIAQVAKEHSERCVFEHSTGSGFGENLYIGGGQLENAVAGAIDLFHGEIVDYDYETNSCTTDKVCGHYTQVVWANSYRVGCGAAKCIHRPALQGANDIIYNLITCNYRTPGNFVGQRPYESGEPCSECGQDDYCFEDLCANEERDGKSFTTDSPTQTDPPSSSTMSPTDSPSSSTMPPTDSPSSSTMPPTESPSSSTMPPTDAPSSSTMPPTVSPSSSTIPPTDSSTSSTMPPTDSPSSSTEPPYSSTPTTGCPTTRGCTVSACEYLEMLKEYKREMEKWKQAFGVRNDGCDD